MTAAAVEILDWHGLRLAVNDGVLPPWYSTEAMTRTISQIKPCRKKGTIIDVGCGSGVLGLYAALAWPGTTAVLIDIDPVAARAASRSVALSARRLDEQGSKAVVICADGLSALASGLCPDVVLCNLPFDPEPAPMVGEDVWGPRARAFRDPGYEAHARVLSDLAERLRTGCRLVLASSPTIGDTRRLGELVRASGLRLTEARTFWFHTPRRGDTKASNAYRVSILQRESRW